MSLASVGDSYPGTVKISRSIVFRDHTNGAAPHDVFDKTMAICCLTFYCDEHSSLPRGSRIVRDIFHIRIGVAKQTAIKFSR
jgi:hypothetical protein